MAYLFKFYFSLLVITANKILKKPCMQLRLKIFYNLRGISNLAKMAYG